MRVSLCLLTVWLFLACADRARGNCTNSFLVKTDGKGEIYPNPQSIIYRKRTSMKKNKITISY